MMSRFLSKRAAKKGDVANDGRYPERLIQLHNVVKAYKTEAGDFLALKDIQLAIGDGEFVGVIGKSGSGKSTLINMIAGIDRPTSGEIYIGGTPIHRLAENGMAKVRGHRLGIVFQFFQLLPLLTAIENVMLPMDFCKLYSTRERRKRAFDLLDLVGLANHGNKLPSMLSGGEQQRVAVARALANDPPIILADEPTGNLDSKTAELVFQLFEELVVAGKTILMVTHDRDLTKRVKRTINIADGEIFEEFLAMAFPSLTQQQLVWATSGIELQRYSAGSIIIQHGDPGDNLYIVTEGHVEVVLQAPGGGQSVVARVETGQHFGEIELLQGGTNIATVRAPLDSDVEVAVLQCDTFRKLISESESTKEEVDRVAQERLKENVAADREMNSA